MSSDALKTCGGTRTKQKFVFVFHKQKIKQTEVFFYKVKHKVLINYAYVVRLYFEKKIQDSFSDVPEIPLFYVQ
jgi:hypothetical protein